MDWHEAAAIPRRSVLLAAALGGTMRLLLWTLQHLLIVGGAGVLIAAWFLRRWRMRRAPVLSPRR